MPKYGINKAVLLGNVGTAPELRYLDQGIAVCSFRLATTERAKARDGNYFDRTDWHNIVLWRQKAEIAAKYLRVGSGVYIEGRIVTRSWDGPDGQKRNKTEVEASIVRLLDANAHPQSPAAPATPAQQAPAPAADSTNKSNNDDDDLPF
ncbi:MAG: single-stranded DNA-binding protein [Bacteroidota bacterium]